MKKARKVFKYKNIKYFYFCVFTTRFFSACIKLLKFKFLVFEDEQKFDFFAYMYEKKRQGRK